MKIAIYLQSGMLATVLEGITNPKLTCNELTFDQGSITGIDENHILLDDSTEVPETLEEATALDQKEQYTIEKVDEVAELKAQLQAAREENEMNALAIMELAELVLGGGL
jgi:regulator of RNase E activity RraA